MQPSKKPPSPSRAASATPAEELCSLPTSEGPYLFSEATTERNAFSVGQIERDDGRAVIAAAASQGGPDQARGHLAKIAALEHEPFEPIVIQHTVDAVGRQHQQLSAAEGLFDDMDLGARPRADHIGQRIAHRMLQQRPEI